MKVDREDVIELWLKKITVPSKTREMETKELIDRDYIQRLAIDNPYIVSFDFISEDCVEILIESELVDLDKNLYRNPLTLETVQTDGDFRGVFSERFYKDEIGNFNVKEYLAGLRNYYDGSKYESEEYNYKDPNHYDIEGKQVWNMMIDIFGKEDFLAFCKLNAFKYRMRLGNKPGEPIERDYEKIKWYEDKIRELSN